VQAFQRELERRPGVLWSSSIVDSVVAPATRALHDGDPVFATVPPTRRDVGLALQPWQRSDRAGVARQLDAEARRVAVEMLVAPAVAASAASPARPLASTLLALAGIVALGASLLRSARGGVLCALPAAATALVVLALARAFAGGLGGAGAALAALAASVSAAFGLQLLVRTRALLAERAQLEVALSLARETAPRSRARAWPAPRWSRWRVRSRRPISRRSRSPARCPARGRSSLALLPPLARATRGRFFAAPRTYTP
jgi:hypothetical protein